MTMIHTIMDWICQQSMYVQNVYKHVLSVIQLLLQCVITYLVARTANCENQIKSNLFSNTK